MATNYTGVDLDRYNAGNKFYSQDRYLQGTGLDKPAITFNPSNYDTGITSQYGNNSMYGNLNSSGDSMGATMPIGNFNQYSGNRFLTGPISGAAPGSFRAAQDIGIDQTPVGRFDGLKNIAGKVGNYGLKAMSSQMGSQGGAMLGGLFSGGILPILLGAGAGGKFGFDAVGREPTDSQKVETNFYGNQGNSPMQYLDEEGNLVSSNMQGYNINSMYGKGIASALDKRLSTVINTINRPGYTGSLGEKGGLLEKLKLEREALANAPGVGYNGDNSSGVGLSAKETNAAGHSYDEAGLDVSTGAGLSANETNSAGHSYDEAGLNG